MRLGLASVLLLAGSLAGLAACGANGPSNADGRVAGVDGGRFVEGLKDAARRVKQGVPSKWRKTGLPPADGAGGDTGAGGTGGEAGEGGAGGDTGGGGAGGEGGVGGAGGEAGAGGIGGEAGAGGTGGEAGAGGTGGGAEPRFVAERWVAPDGDDTNPGTADRPWRTLGHAATALLPGEGAYVREGVYDAFRIDVRDGTAAAPITLLAAPGARPQIRGGTVEFRRAHWVLEGFDISPATAAFAVRFTGSGSIGNVLRNNLVHDGGAGAGISVDLGASDVTIEGNEIWNFSRGGDTDSHGVVVQPNTAGVRVLRNHIHDNNGDSVQCLGPESTSAGGAPARDLLIEGNYLHHDRENAVDIKTCHDVVIRGNRAHSYFDTATSNGEGIVVHYAAARVIVEENDVSDVNRGIVVGKQASDVLVRRNVFHDGNGERVGIYFYEGSTMQAFHNTLVNLAAGLKVGTASGVTVANNVFAGCGTGVSGSAVVDRNLFFGAPATGTGAVEGDPLFDATYVPGAGSPAVDAAKAIPGEPDACGAGPDLGAKERC